jgi:hypothetical protein
MTHEVPDNVEIYDIVTGEDELNGVPVDRIKPVSDNTRIRPDDARLGYIGQGPANTAREIDALSEFDIAWTDEAMKDALTSMDREDSSYRITVKGELDDYEVDIAPEEVYKA